MQCSPLAVPLYPHGMQYHGFKAVRLAVCSRLASDRVELQRFSTSQGIDIEALVPLEKRIAGGRVQAESGQ